MKKLTKELQQTIINEDGIVLSETKHQQFYVDNEPDYIKFYIGDMIKLKGLPNSVGTVLFSLLERMGYKNNICINASLKRIITEETGITEHGIKKAIEHLNQSQIIIRQDRGLYMFNPFLFGRGKWQDIKAIRMTIEYNEKGRTEKTDFDYQENNS